MYKLKNTIVRSIVAIIIGIVLIKWPRLAPNMIIIIIGILFIIPGIVTLINYWIRKSKEGMKLPSYILIESTGSILLGLCMALIPEFFTAFFMYCLGFLLVLGGITQIISLVNIQRNIPISLYYYITPILILIAGIITVLNPFETQDAILIMFGICAIIYGITELVNYYKLDPESELIVVFDDISLEPGNIRIRKKGSAGGHNGIKNIIAMTGTQNFMRIKVGVGEKPKGWDLADYVLGHFSTEDRAKVEEAIGHAMDAAVLMMQGEVDKAMNDYNSKNK